MKAKASPGEINRELSLLKRMYTLAIQAGKAAHPPVYPDAGGEQRAGGVLLDREQFDALRRHLPEAVQPVATFAYVTGWRTRSEVLPLQWRQVDLDAGTVRLDPGTTKNGEGRVFHLTAEVAVAARSAASTSGISISGRTRRSARGYSTATGSASRASGVPGSPAAKAAGRPGAIPHDLRRTAVRNLVRAGVPERVSMQLTGHKTRSVFERYNIVSDSDLIDAARKLDIATIDRHSRPPGRSACIGGISLSVTSVLRLSTAAPVAQVDRATVS